MIFASGVRLIRKNNNATTIIDGPDGVSHSSDPNKPPITDNTPTTEARIAICSGSNVARLAAAAGIINNAVIKRTPTILIDIAITMAINMKKTIEVLSGSIPSAAANS